MFRFLFPSRQKLTLYFEAMFLFCNGNDWPTSENMAAYWMVMSSLKEWSACHPTVFFYHFHLTINQFFETYTGWQLPAYWKSRGEQLAIMFCSSSFGESLRNYNTVFLNKFVACLHSELETRGMNPVADLSPKSVDIRVNNPKKGTLEQMIRVPMSNLDRIQNPNIECIVTVKPKQCIGFQMSDHGQPAYATHANIKDWKVYFPPPRNTVPFFFDAQSTPPKGWIKVAQKLTYPGMTECPRPLPATRNQLKVVPVDLTRQLNTINADLILAQNLLCCCGTDNCCGGTKCCGGTQTNQDKTERQIQKLIRCLNKDNPYAQVFITLGTINRRKARHHGEKGETLSEYNLRKKMSDDQKQRVKKAVKKLNEKSKVITIYNLGGHQFNAYLIIRTPAPNIDFKTYISTQTPPLFLLGLLSDQSVMPDLHFLRWQLAVAFNRSQRFFTLLILLCDLFLCICLSALAGIISIIGNIPFAASLLPALALVELIQRTVLSPLFSSLDDKNITPLSYPLSYVTNEWMSNIGTASALPTLLSIIYVARFHRVLNLALAELFDETVEVPACVKKTLTVPLVNNRDDSDEAGPVASAIPRRLL